MPARDIDREGAETEEKKDLAVQPPEAQQATFSAEGDLPAVGKEGAATAAAATASEMAFGETQPATTDTSALDSGVHHWENYKAACEAAGKPDKWQDKYRHGHSEATQFVQPYDGRGEMEWTLKAGQSASQGVKDWLKGTTIADYRAAGVAAELDELRDELGDQKFDKLFGSSNKQEDSGVEAAHRLKITSSMYTVPFVDQMKAYAAEKDAKSLLTAEPVPALAAEQREEKPKPTTNKDNQDAVVVAKELGIERNDREIV